MKHTTLSVALLLAVGLIYISIFTYLVSYVSQEWFNFNVFHQTPALVLTLALAISTLFASPLLPQCIRLLRCFDKIGRRLL